MSQRKKLRKRVAELDRADGGAWSGGKKDARIKEMQGWIGEIAVLTCENAALVSEKGDLAQQLRETQEELQIFKDRVLGINSEWYSESGLIASGVSAAPRGKAHENALAAPAHSATFQPGAEADKDVELEFLSRASFADNVPTLTSSADESEPRLALHRATSIPGLSPEDNFGTSHGPTPPSPSVRNKPAEEEDQDPWSEHPATTHTSQNSPFITDPAAVARLINFGIPPELAESYFKRGKHDIALAADLYFKDVEDCRDFFDRQGVPVEWRNRLLDEINDDPVAAVDMWRKIEDQVQLLRGMNRTDEEVWRFMTEEHFDSERVRYRLEQEAGYGGEAWQGGDNGDSGVGSGEGSGDDDDPDGLYSE